MRLSQIARKLGATQGELSEKLVSNGENAPEGGNSKLTDSQITLLFRLYDYSEPEEKEEEVVAEADIEVSEPAEPIIEIKEEVIEEEPQKQVEEIDPEPVVEKAIPEEAEPEEEVEVIRAKKIKLEGIKVLGKIELPEKPVKVKEEAEAEEKTEEKPARRQLRNKRSNHKNRRRKPELSFEEKQALEERNRLKEKRKRERQLKEKKKKYFEQNIKPKQEEVGIKQKKKKKKELSKAATQKRTKVTTKNPFKKFWIWLNDPYA